MSNGLAAVASTLATRFTSGMASSLSSTPYVFDNGPELATPPNPRTGEFVRWSFRPATGRPASLGRVHFRLFGLLDIQIFTPLGKGSGRATAISEAIQAMYRDTSITGVFVRDTSFQQVGETDGWYQTQLRIQFLADETL